MLHRPSFYVGTTEVLVTGTFNILHAGHVELLEFANKFGQVTVGINSDPYMKKKYGEYAVPLLNRVYVLKSCKFVNDVVFFEQDNPSGLIKSLRPEYFVRGPDYLGVKLPEQDALDEVGCQLIVQPTDKKFDSSHLIKSLGKSHFKKLDRFD